MILSVDGQPEPRTKDSAAGEAGNRGRQGFAVGRMGGPYAARLIRLNYLAPDIVAAILGGKQPADLTANKLMADTRFPVDWRAQRAALGFV